MLRKIVEIDEEKCDGCGLCADACAESAIQIVDGKARLIGESYCDGLGACIGECPNDAITVSEREAEEFDAEAVEQHRVKLAARNARAKNASSQSEGVPHACPGSLMRDLRGNREMASGQEESEPGAIDSRLRNWPVQLRLVPVDAPYFQGADLLLAADCVPFAMAGFHRKLLDEKVLLIGCPKLDDAAYYREKLATILSGNDINSLSVVHMEVPCCFGLVELARRAIEESGKDIAFSTIKVSIAGDVLRAQQQALN